MLSHWLCNIFSFKRLFFSILILVVLVNHQSILLFLNHWFSARNSANSSCVINSWEMNSFSTVDFAEHSSKHVACRCTSSVLDRTSCFVERKLVQLAWSCLKKVVHSEIWIIALFQTSWLQHDFENVSCWVSERTTRMFDRFFLWWHFINCSFNSEVTSCCCKTKSHLSMTHETALIRLHLQNSWEYRLSFIEISQAKLLSCIFRVHENIDYHS